jgi:SNF2 family DNA or RNA helicase
MPVLPVRLSAQRTGRPCLWADDPGAGRTIVAGLLLKELKAHGLVKRTLIVMLANLTVQRQQEMRDKLRAPQVVVEPGPAASPYEWVSDNNAGRPGAPAASSWPTVYAGGTSPFPDP